MRLINTNNLELKEFWEHDLPQYAILSHCWGESDDEVTLQQFQARTNQSGEGFHKIEHCCRIARDQGLQWAWVDTCCIDKTSSAELSEAINSMYLWYEWSAVCYVFLHELDEEAQYKTSCEPRDSGDIAELNTCATISPADKTQIDAVTPVEGHRALFRSRWLTRGWTLQELLAPREVLFYDQNLQLVGTRNSLANQLETLTGIDTRYLTQKEKLYKACIAQRMSWASARETTRPEDKAYCLVGIFNVNLPLLYGEGLAKAFFRLQERIIAQSTDESIFAWRSTHNEDRGLLAECPADFARSGLVRRQPVYPPRPPYRLTNRGIELVVKLSDMQGRNPWYALLDFLEKLYNRQAGVLWSTHVTFPLACSEYRPNLPAHCLPHRIAIRLKSQRIASGAPEASWCRVETSTWLPAPPESQLPWRELGLLNDWTYRMYVIHPAWIEEAGEAGEDSPQLGIDGSSWPRWIIVNATLVVAFPSFANHACRMSGQCSPFLTWAILSLGLMLTSWKVVYCVMAIAWAFVYNVDAK